MSSGYSVAVLGASGAVGREMMKVLEERKFPVSKLRALASERSAGSELEFNGTKVVVEKVGPDSFKGIQIALFSPGAKVSREYGPIAAKAGAVVIDNSSAFRMVDEIPLVVPEVNPLDIKKYEARGIIANPNCSTIQLVVAIKPIHDAARVKRIVVASYQSVSGAGQKGIAELEQQVRDLFNMRETKNSAFPHRIAFNCIPHIGSFTDSGDTEEELKMVNETRKIMGDPSIRVAATTVRVPVFVCHSEAVNLELERPLSANDARALLAKAPGVRVIDDPKSNGYPLALDAAGQDDTLVGRIRDDKSVEHGLQLWVVADNLRKGAASNAVQIAEILAHTYLH